MQKQIRTGRHSNERAVTAAPNSADKMNMTLNKIFKK